jgi:hypothetical protein
MKINAVLKCVGASGDSCTSIGMRTHHPMQTDTLLQIMNIAVPATIQSDVEKRRKASIKGGSLDDIHVRTRVMLHSRIGDHRLMRRLLTCKRC